MKEETEKRERGAGVLMSISSLPSPHGIGTMGRAAREWVDFLCEAGQSYWQVLPIGPTGFGDSPYQSFSAFAGNPYFIDLDLLQEEGLLSKDDIDSVDWAEDESKVSYGVLFENRERLLRKAEKNFNDEKQLAAFIEKNKDWIMEYALYMSIKAANDLKAWTQWQEPLRLHLPQAVSEAKKKYEKDIRYHCFVQYLFFKQWKDLKEYANSRGVRIIGDIPIYVSMDSSDVWCNNELFLLDENKTPIAIAGCPPDAFAPDGQLWGNPLYRWDVLKETKYHWWHERLHHCLLMYDILRIDHFRGLESYYSIPYGDSTAKNGKWEKGPGIDFIKAINSKFGKAEIIAEDLGFLTEEVTDLLKQSGYPGMKVLQFAFDSREESDYMPFRYSKNSIAYTGTHDNDTVKGWFETAPEDDVKTAKMFLGVNNSSSGVWAFIRNVLSSHSKLAVIPMQDYLLLGSSARMNTPSTIGGNNWCWRMKADALSPKLAKKMHALSKVNGRLTVSADCSCVKHQLI